MVRRICQSLPLSEVLTEEVSPGPDVTADGAIKAFLLDPIETEFHPGNTLAVLSRDKGVVDAKLNLQIGKCPCRRNFGLPFLFRCPCKPPLPSVIPRLLTRFLKFKHRFGFTCSLNRHQTSFAMTGDRDRLGQDLTARAMTTAQATTSLDLLTHKSFCVSIPGDLCSMYMASTGSLCSPGDVLVTHKLTG